MLTVRTAVNKTRYNTLFIRRWLYQMKDHGLPGYHHSTTSPRSFVSSHVTTPVERVTPRKKGGPFEIARRRGRSKSLFSFSSGHKRNSPRRRKEDGGPEEENEEEEYGNRKSRCDNLLKNCRPEVNSRGADNRSLTTRRKTRTEIANQSQRR